MLPIGNGNILRRLGDMTKFDVPAKISEAWLLEQCPKLAAIEALTLVQALRARGWRHGVTGSLDDRVIERLKPGVKAKVVDGLAEE
jgi:hypothetical protein